MYVYIYSYIHHFILTFLHYKQVCLDKCKYFHPLCNTLLCNGKPTTTIYVNHHKVQSVVCSGYQIDHRETKLLIEEELRKQRDSFFRKWDFNIENFRSLNESKPTNENSRKRSLENDENDIENPAKRLSFADEKSASINGDENIAAVPRRVLQPRNDTQRQITGKCKYSINIIVILIYSLSYNLVYNYSRN